MLGEPSGPLTLYLAGIAWSANVRDGSGAIGCSILMTSAPAFDAEYAQVCRQVPSTQDGEQLAACRASCHGCPFDDTYARKGLLVLQM